MDPPRPSTSKSPELPEINDPSFDELLDRHLAKDGGALTLSGLPEAEDGDRAVLEALRRPEVSLQEDATTDTGTFAEWNFFEESFLPSIGLDPWGAIFFGPDDGGPVDVTQRSLCSRPASGEAKAYPSCSGTTSNQSQRQSSADASQPVILTPLPECDEFLASGDNSSSGNYTSSSNKIQSQSPWENLSLGTSTSFPLSAEKGVARGKKRPADENFTQMEASHVLEKPPQKKRRKFEKEELEKVNNVRDRGACIRCQMLKAPVSHITDIFIRLDLCTKQ